MTEPTPENDALAAARTRVVELFGAVCASPDDAAVAADADRALQDLDALMAAAD